MNSFSLPPTAYHELSVENTPSADASAPPNSRRVEVKNKEFPSSQSVPFDHTRWARAIPPALQKPQTRVQSQVGRHFDIASEIAIELLNEPQDQSTGIEQHHDDCEYGHHDEAELDRVLQKLLGVDTVDERLLRNRAVVPEPLHHAGPPPGFSELDDAPGAILVAKPALVELQNAHAPRGNDHAARLHHFQGHELSHSTGDFGLNLGLDGAMGVAGSAALIGGVMDFRDSGKREEMLKGRQKAVEEKIRAFSRFLVSQEEAGPSETADAEHARLRKISILQRDLIVLEADLQKLNQALRNCGSEKKVALGSGAAGLISLIRAVVGFAAKPLAYYLPATTGASGSLLSAASGGLAPLGAAAALYMGRKARNLSESQRKEAEEKFDAAFRELGLVESKVPGNIWEHYKRCFVDTKLLSHKEKTKSFHELLKWFVRAMWGYLGTSSAVSIAKIIALLVAGAVAADVTLSVGVLTAATAVLLTLYGFMRYQSKMNRHALWATSVNPGLDKDFMLGMAATGDVRGFIQANKLSMLFHRKRERLYDFRHLLQQEEKAGLLFDGLKIHSTDTGATREKRKEQKQEAGSSAKQRFFATHGCTSARKKLSAVLQSPRHHDHMMNYMLEDLEDDLRYLDDEIHQKIRQLDLDSKDVTCVASESRHKINRKQAEFSERVSKKKAKQDYFLRCRFRQRHSSVPIGGPKFTNPEQHIERHFREKGLALFNDKVRYREMHLLRNQLLQERGRLSRKPERMADLQSRFLSVQQRCAHDSSANANQPASQRWAQDLEKGGSAEKRIRATLGQLEVLMPETAVLRQAANSVSNLLPGINVSVPGWDVFLQANEIPAC